MRRGYTIRWSLGVGIVIMLSLCGTLSYADTAKDGRAAIGPAVSDMVGPFTPGSAREADQKQPSSASVGVVSEVALRTIPSVSTLVSVGGVTLVPYVAAGFGGGYVTERDRVLHTVPSTSSLSNPTTAGLRSLLGPHLIPNELHLGIRVPF
ncbi:MAG: hypothetical protein OEV01_06890 [Nitrospira sp.]|nr:hypothetical protein [Nitrospira sp.]MDH4304318.1 hypothetical protein [Nitrospira sp.]